MAFGALLGQNSGYTKEEIYSAATQALYPSGTDFPDQALALLSKAIVESQDGTELKNLMGEVIASLPLSGAQIETGSYVGTGTAGASNPTSLTFNLNVDFLVIMSADESSMNGTSNFLNFAIMVREISQLGTTQSNDNVFPNPIAITWENNSVSWYHTYKRPYAIAQYNQSGKTYYYVAFGR